MLLQVSKLVAKLRNRMLVRVEGSWENLEVEEEVALQTTTPSLEARLQEEEEEGGEVEVDNPPASTMPTPLASTRRGAGEEEEGGEVLTSVIHHPP